MQKHEVYEDLNAKTGHIYDDSQNRANFSSKN